MLVIGQGVVEWVAKRTNEFGNFGASQGIGWQRDGRIVAGTVFADWNGVNVVAHIASDESRRWLTREYLWTIFDYPFNQLKVARVTLEIGEGNADSRRFAAHLGFTLEAPLKAAHPTGDLLIYRMFRKDCKYLRASWTKADFSKKYAKAA